MRKGSLCVVWLIVTKPGKVVTATSQFDATLFPISILTKAETKVATQLKTKPPNFHDEEVCRMAKPHLSMHVILHRNL